MVVLDLKEPLTPDIVGDWLLFKFVDEGRWVKRTFGDEEREVFEITVTEGTNTFIWRANLKSLRAIAREYGKDTSQWVGKPVELYTVLQNVFGKERKVIYARKPKGDVPGKSDSNGNTN